MFEKKFDEKQNSGGKTLTTRIVCIRPKGRTQGIFPRSQHSCLYVDLYIFTKSEFISSCSLPAA